MLAVDWVVPKLFLLIRSHTQNHTHAHAQARPHQCDRGYSVRCCFLSECVHSGDLRPRLVMIFAGEGVQTVKVCAVTFENDDIRVHLFTVGCGFLVMQINRGLWRLNPSEKEPTHPQKSLVISTTSWVGVSGSYRGRAKWDFHLQANIFVVCA